MICNFYHVVIFHKKLKVNIPALSSIHLIQKVLK